MSSFKMPFFVIDGIDGCGKTTQTKLLSEALISKGYHVTTVRDPGGTTISEQIRKIILSNDNHLMCAKTELFLYTASRMQLIEEILRPKREAGEIIVSDRFFTSTIAYQSFGGGLPLDFVKTVVSASVKDFLPTATFIIDLPIEVAEERLDAVRDRMELKSMEFKNKVRNGFLKQAAENKDIIPIDGTLSVNVIHKAIMGVVNELL
jgi:dTMP kinase